MYKYIIKAYSGLIRHIGCVSVCIDNKKKQSIMSLMVFILCVLGILRHIKTPLKEIIHYTDVTAIIIGTAALFILLVAAADKCIDYSRVSIKKPCLYGWLLCFTIALIMAFINPVRTGYFVWCIVSLFFSIPFIMIWAARDDFLQFCILLARTTTTATGCFVIINLIFVPFIKPPEIAGYSGLMSNPNGNGMVIAGMYAACFFLLLIEDDGRFASSVIAGFLIAFSYVSDCRTAQLVIALESIVGTGYCLKYIKAKGKGLNIKKIVMTCVIVVITTIAASFLLTEIGRMDINAYAYDNAAGITSEESVAILLRKLDVASSGRVRIWRRFLSQVTFWGNGSPGMPLIPGVEASLYAHNNAIEILYTSGVLAFIGYTIFLMSGIGFVIRCFLGKNDCKIEYILVMMAFVGYFVEAMLEIVMYPMCHMPAILLNLCMMPIFINIKKEPNQIQNTTGGQNA